MNYGDLFDDLFEDLASNWILSTIKSHFLKYRELINIEDFKVYIKTDKSLNETMKKSIVGVLKEILGPLIRERNNFEFVKNETVTFLKRKQMEKALVKSVDLIQLNKFEDIRTLINKASLACENKSEGMSILDVDVRYNQKGRHPIPTGFVAIDAIIDGGLSGGELGVILAPSSTGKSWFLEHLAVNAAKDGKNVVYYTLEDEEDFHAKRIDSILTNISTSDLIYHRDLVKEKVNNLKGHIIFKHYPQLVTTINSFHSHLNRLKLLNKFPDIVFIDYGDIMGAVEKKGDDWKNQQQIFNEIKSFAQIQKIPVWTAAQANKTGKLKDVVEDTDMAQAYAKVAPSNIILSLSRKIEDKLTGTGRLFVAKNKVGDDSIILPFSVDNSKGIMKIHTAETQEGKEITEQMKNGNESIKLRLRTKLEEFKKQQEL